MSRGRLAAGIALQLAAGLAALPIIALLLLCSLVHDVGLYGMRKLSPWVDALLIAAGF